MLKIECIFVNDDDNSDEIKGLNANFFSLTEYTLCNLDLIRKGVECIKLDYVVRLMQDRCYTLTLPELFSEKFLSTHENISIEHSDHTSNIFEICKNNLEC